MLTLGTTMRCRLLGLSQSRACPGAVRCPAPASRTALMPAGAPVPMTTPDAGPELSKRSPKVMAPDAATCPRRLTGWPARAGVAQTPARTRASMTPMDFSPRMTSRLHLGVGLQHLVGGGDDLGVHLVGALGDDKRGDLADRVDVGGFGIALQNGAKALQAGRPHRRRAGGVGLGEEVVALGLQAGIVEEAGQLELTHLLWRGCASDLDLHLAGR